MPRIRRREHVTTVDMVACRTIGHCWYPIDAQRRPQWGVLWQLRCERCQSVRDDIVGSTGLLESRAYNYTEGYKDAGLAQDNQADRRAWLLAELDMYSEPKEAPALRVVDGGKRKRKAS
jgi:hypothetical protein